MGGAFRLIDGEFGVFWQINAVFFIIMFFVSRAISGKTDSKEEITSDFKFVIMIGLFALSIITLLIYPIIFDVVSEKNIDKKFDLEYFRDYIVQDKSLTSSEKYELKNNIKLQAEDDYYDNVKIELALVILIIAIFYFYDKKDKIKSYLVDSINSNPPPIPEDFNDVKLLEKFEYFVVIQNEKKGGFNNYEIKKLLEEKIINLETNIWRKGMKNWQKVKDVEELPLILKSYDDNDLPF